MKYIIQKFIYAFFLASCISNTSCFATENETLTKEKTTHSSLKEGEKREKKPLLFALLLILIPIVYILFKHKNGLNNREDENKLDSDKGSQTSQENTNINNPNNKEKDKTLEQQLINQSKEVKGPRDNGTNKNKLDSDKGSQTSQENTNINNPNNKEKDKTLEQQLINQSKEVKGPRDNGTNKNKLDSDKVSQTSQENTNINNPNNKEKDKTLEQQLINQSKEVKGPRDNGTNKNKLDSDKVSQTSQENTNINNPNNKEKDKTLEQQLINQSKEVKGPRDNGTNKNKLDSDKVSQTSQKIPEIHPDIKKVQKNLLKHNKNELLYLYTKQGKKEAVEYLINIKNADVNFKNARESDKTALYIACRNGKKGIVELLLKNGADTKVKTKDMEETPLHTACVSGEKNIVELLLKEGADVTLTDYNGNTPLFSLLEEHLLSRNKIGSAKLGIIKLLVNKKTNINIDAEGIKGKTALCIACEQYWKEVIEILLENGANPNGNNDTKERPLHIACKYGERKDIIKILLEKGADPNLKDNKKKTALHIVCQYHKKEVVKVLLDKKGNPNLPDGQGNTALHIACKNSFKSGDYGSVVEELLKEGVDVTLKNNKNQTAINIVYDMHKKYKRNNPPKIIKILITHYLIYKKIELPDSISNSEDPFIKSIITDVSKQKKENDSLTN